MAMELVSTVTVGSGGATLIQFTSIPQTGKDLLLVLSGRNTGNSAAFSIRPNGATTNLSARRLTGTGVSVSSNTDTSLFGYVSVGTATANTFGNTQAYFSNYTSAVAKTVSIDGVNEKNATEANQVIIAGLWDNSAAITSIDLVPLSSGTAVENTSASLYIIS